MMSTKNDRSLEEGTRDAFQLMMVASRKKQPSPVKMQCLATKRRKLSLRSKKQCHNSKIRDQTDTGLLSSSVPRCPSCMMPTVPRSAEWTLIHLQECLEVNRSSLQDTPFTVDAFSYGSVLGIKCYFLSHFHSDHYVGLTRSFKHSIYCSQVTANLVNLKIGVAKRYLRALPLNEPCIVEGTKVTLLDANHCPGSVMFVFNLPDGRVYLHTGDFRASPSMESFHILNSEPVDCLYLDTTYCDPAYNFPPQDCILQFVASLVTKTELQNPRTLFVCGSYTIGKEKVFLAAAKALRCQIWAQTEKQRVLRALQDDDITSRLVNDSKQAKVHILRMQDLYPKALHQYLAQFTGLYNAILALKPTGWEHTPNLTADNLNSIKPLRAGSVTIYGVPYSEHSSFGEMRKFVQFLQPKRIIPTVNVGSRTARSKMETIFKKWLDCKM